MITREMFLEALKQMEEASAVIEAYQMQFSDENKNFTKNKDQEDLEVGDFVECIEVHLNSKENLTQGVKYQVRRTDKYGFTIETDKGVKRKYSFGNSQFKALA